MSKLPDVVFVLGGPGAGKGTQCQFIVQVSYSFISHACFFVLLDIFIKAVLNILLSVCILEFLDLQTFFEYERSCVSVNK